MHKGLPNRGTFSRGPILSLSSVGKKSNIFLNYNECSFLSFLLLIPLSQNFPDHTFTYNRGLLLLQEQDHKNLKKRAMLIAEYNVINFVTGYRYTLVSTCDWNIVSLVD